MAGLMKFLVIGPLIVGPKGGPINKVSQVQLTGSMY